MWHFLRGYVILQIEGLSIARLMRRMVENGVRIRGAERTSPTSVRLTIDAKRFFDLRRIAKGLHVRIRILDKRGLPFAARKLLARPVLWIGTLLLAAGICFASSRIWFIRIEGTDRVADEEVTERLKAHGLYPGARPKGPILITAANDLSVELKDAAWVGLDREGVTLTVRVVEALPESQKRSLLVPSDVIAVKDGVLTDLLVTHGQARVAIDDTVRAGDVLISGTVVRQDASYETWADGRITAAVPYRAECETVGSVTETVESGRTETIRAVRLGSWVIGVGRSGFERYRVRTVRSVGVSDRLPVWLDEITVGELVQRERTLHEEEAEQLAAADALEAARAQVPKNAAILHQYSVIKTVRGKTTAAATVIAEESIGRTEERPHGGKHGESG